MVNEKFVGRQVSQNSRILAIDVYDEGPEKVDLLETEDGVAIGIFLGEVD